MSYTGSGYARYTLTEEGVRQRRQTEEEGEIRSTYSDMLSLTLHTTHPDGLLFAMYNKTASEYLYVAVSLIYLQSWLSTTPIHPHVYTCYVES